MASGGLRRLPLLGRRLRRRRPVRPPPRRVNTHTLTNSGRPNSTRIEIQSVILTLHFLPTAPSKKKEKKL
ncbi:hypothetical protein EE612_009068 [Oryza sativa]|nr:hypothetical protein EE612_009068 [Oryza sativa]